MKENLIIVTCKVPSEAYQILSAVRQKPKRKWIKVSYGALVKRDAGKLSMEDGFAADSEEDEWALTGALIGGLLGLQAGAAGAMVAGGIGVLIGDSLGKKEMKGMTILLEKVSECLTDGEAALLLLAKEKDETTLAEKLGGFHVSIIRMDAEEIAVEIKRAKKEKKEKKREAAAMQESVSMREAAAKIQADKIIKNATIFTADKDNPQAAALAVKDGKFVYVGDEAGLAAYEGEVADLGGKFIMPGLIDSHVHVTWPIGFEYATIDGLIACCGKQEALDIMAKVIREKPGLERYRFLMEQKSLNGEELMKEDLDAICPDSELQIQEAEGHSIWVNSRLLASHGITDDTPDPVPGLSYYERKDGHLTGNIIECSAEVPIILDSSMHLSDEQIDAALTRWIDFSLDAGVNAIFDAGIPGYAALHERVYTRLRELDMQGKLPIYVDGCYVIAAPWQAKEGLEELKRFRREFNTEHLKVHTMKIFMDGTFRIHTAAMLEPFADTGTTGASTAFKKEELAALLKQLNEEDLDLHLHTVGDAASRTVLDAVEIVRNELGERFHIKVTCAHLEVQADEDLGRFAKLGVYANFTPSWHSGNGSGDALKPLISLLGERRATHMYRSKTLWDSGALVTWSSDNTIFLDFSAWNPYLGMEVGMTRWTTEKTNAPEISRTIRAFPPDSEKMSIEEMLLGYTINGAIQLGIEDSKGSITVGKDADYLVFDNNLLTAEHDSFSYNVPRDVYFCGKKLN